ncbi:MAG: hypothetical protein JHC33_03365 [Ignisphaera sp.]|nr:hypothetical protein [Ignisphaera sp.]
MKTEIALILAEYEDQESAALEYEDYLARKYCVSICPVFVDTDDLYLLQVYDNESGIMLFREDDISDLDEAEAIALDFITNREAE